MRPKHLAADPLESSSPQPAVEAASLTAASEENISGTGDAEEEPKEISEALDLPYAPHHALLNVSLISDEDDDLKIKSESLTNEDLSEENLEAHQAISDVAECQEQLEDTVANEMDSRELPKKDEEEATPEISETINSTTSIENDCLVELAEISAPEGSEYMQLEVATFAGEVEVDSLEESSETSEILQSPITLAEDGAETVRQPTMDVQAIVSEASSADEDKIDIENCGFEEKSIILEALDGYMNPGDSKAGILPEEDGKRAIHAQIRSVVF